MNEIIIRSEGLTRDFSSVRALDQVTFEVPSGIVFGYLGPNGSGKTTTIRLLLGLLTPSGGRAEVLGQDTRQGADAIRQNSGALLEHTGLYERLTAYDNLDFYARAWGMPLAQRQARIQELLTHVGLWERRKEQVGNWSRGMKQKVAVARVLLHHPRLVFLDEPTAGLDPVAAASLREDLTNLVSQEGATVFLTTHNLAEAEKLCAQVAVIRAGKLLAQGSPDALRASNGGSGRLEVHGRNFSEALLSELRGRPEVSAVNRENSHLLVDLSHPDADSAGLISLMVTRGAQIEEVRKGKASLEDVFLTLMEEEKEG